MTEKYDKAAQNKKTLREEKKVTQATDAEKERNQVSTDDRN